MLPYLLFADQKGQIYSHPRLRMCGAGLSECVLPAEEELSLLPAGSNFFFFPRRYPLGYDPDRNRFQVLTEYEGEPVSAVACFPVPGYVRLYNPAYALEKKEIMPLWAYTACGFYGGRFYAAACRIDPRLRQTPRYYDQSKVKAGVDRFLRKYPENRLYLHLAHCALEYHCLAAKNLFLNRWEAPVPVSNTCNASCLGCISQPSEEFCAAQERIKFRPSVKELVEVMAPHLATAREAIVSFGQGCEGDPLLEAKQAALAIKAVRKKVSRGTIHMNTNASLPEKVEDLCRSGIDSFRVSLFSAVPGSYAAYFRPRNYSFKDVCRSVKIMKKHKKFVAVNLLVFPGFTDRSSESRKLFSFISEHKIDMVQFRNLNLDPLYLAEKIELPSGKEQGVAVLIAEIKQRFPGLKTGYFNLPREKFLSF